MKKTAVQRVRQDSALGIRMRAQTEMMRDLSKRLNIQLREQKPERALNRVDGYYEDHCVCVLIQANSHLGALKPAQHDKVASDLLKLLTVEASRKRQCMKILAFADEEACDRLRRGKSWLNEPCRRFGVVVMVAKVSKSTRAALTRLTRRESKQHRPQAARGQLGN